ncbi:MAG: DUF4177 domain-containing protein [Candidatus Omnitrophica bacterium]|nr:DUF4177 domain-containing protein [Candidatus Omnitrophota bacterium]
MVKWEYKVVKCSGTLALGGEFVLAVERELNKHGSEGWEMHDMKVQDSKDPGGKYALLILKRMSK